MKTVEDLEKMKLQSSFPFDNAYESFIMTLEDYYIAKFDGIERIRNELKDWDKEAQRFIISVLIKKIKHEMINFDANDLLELIG